MHKLTELLEGIWKRRECSWRWITWRFSSRTRAKEYYGRPKWND